MQQAQQQQLQQEGAAGQAGPSSASGGSDDAPGGITSKATLAPRLAVEQAEVKQKGSDAGQFGDFSRKPAPRREVGGSAPLPPPRGVLKKAPHFAAGNQSVPIMLAEVKVGYDCSTECSATVPRRCQRPRCAVLGRGCPGNDSLAAGPPSACLLQAASRLSFALCCHSTIAACLNSCDRDQAPVREFLLPPQERQPEVIAAETAAELAPRSRGCTAGSVEGYVPRLSRR